MVLVFMEAQMTQRKQMKKVRSQLLGEVQGSL